MAKLKQALGSGSAADLVEIFDEKSGESRAKVPPMIIACFEGDYDTIKFLLEVSDEREDVERSDGFIPDSMVPIRTKPKVNTISPLSMCSSMGHTKDKLSLRVNEQI